MEALHAVIQKYAIEKVKTLAFFNRLFVVPKSNKWRPILDLSSLEKYLKSETFKTETPESIRPSLKKGKWVRSIDFKDANFHIPKNQQS